MNTIINKLQKFQNLQGVRRIKNIVMPKRTKEVIYQTAMVENTEPIQKEIRPLTLGVGC